MRVVVRLKGGVGNQLFQFAAGLGLANRIRGQLVFDLVSGFVRDRYQRQFELGQLGVAAAEANDVEIRATQVLSRLGRYPSFRRASWSIPGMAVLREGCDLRAWHRPHQIPLAWLFVDGYWQDPRFFPQDSAAIRRSLKIEKLLPTDKDLLTLARSPRTVAVHVRKFSAENPGSAVDLSPDYYSRALRQVGDLIENPEILVFSDDPVSAEVMLRTVVPASMSVKIADCGSPLRDFALMSTCPNAVIANSTFSWWAAWLGSCQQGQVIYPLSRPEVGVWNLPAPLQLPEWTGV